MPILKLKQSSPHISTYYYCDIGITTTSSSYIIVKTFTTTSPSSCLRYYAVTSLLLWNQYSIANSTPRQPGLFNSDAAKAETMPMPAVESWVAINCRQKYL